MLFFSIGILTSHFAALKGQLYGWLPLSDAAGIKSRRVFVKNEEKVATCTVLGKPSGRAELPRWEAWATMAWATTVTLGGVTHYMAHYKEKRRWARIKACFETNSKISETWQGRSVG